MPMPSLGFLERTSKAVKRVENSPYPQSGGQRPDRPIQIRFTLRGKLSGELVKDGSATMRVWRYNGTAEAATSEDVTVYDWMLAEGQSIASGKKVAASYDLPSGRYYITSAECEENE